MACVSSGHPRGLIVVGQNEERAEKKSEKEFERERERARRKRETEREEGRERGGEKDNRALWNTSMDLLLSFYFYL